MGIWPYGSRPSEQNAGLGQGDERGGLVRCSAAAPARAPTWPRRRYCFAAKRQPGSAVGETLGRAVREATLTPTSTPRRAVSYVVGELEAIERDRLADDAFACPEDREHVVGQAQREVGLPGCQAVKVREVPARRRKNELAQHPANRVRPSRVGPLIVHEICATYRECGRRRKGLSELLLQPGRQLVRSRRTLADARASPPATGRATMTAEAPPVAWSGPLVALVLERARRNA